LQLQLDRAPAGATCEISRLVPTLEHNSVAPDRTAVWQNGAIRLRTGVYT
jgi:hypothetical protein